MGKRQTGLNCCAVQSWLMIARSAFILAALFPLSQGAAHAQKPAREDVQAAIKQMIENRAPLDAFQWEKRVLVVWGDERLQKRQTRMLDSKGLRERDVVFVRMIGTGNLGVATLYSSDTKAELKTVDINGSPLEGAGKDANFLAALIGKDGDVKGRWSKPVKTKKLFELIDAMPMRVEEMRIQEIPAELNKEPIADGKTP